VFLFPLLEITRPTLETIEMYLNY